MPRAPRAAIGGIVYHVLNRANALRAGLVGRAEDWRWCSLWRRTCGDAEHRAILAAPSGGWPAGWVSWVNEPQTTEEEAALRLSIARGRPFGSAPWVKRIAAKLGLSITLRPRGRPKERKGS